MVLSVVKEFTITDLTNVLKAFLLISDLSVFHFKIYGVDIANTIVRLSNSYVFQYLSKHI